MWRVLNGILDQAIFLGKNKILLHSLGYVRSETVSATTDMSLNYNKKATKLVAFVEWAGEMSNQIWVDFVKIYGVIMKLNQ